MGNFVFAKKAAVEDKEIPRTYIEALESSTGLQKLPKDVLEVIVSYVRGVSGIVVQSLDSSLWSKTPKISYSESSGLVVISAEVHRSLQAYGGIYKFTGHDNSVRSVVLSGEDCWCMTVKEDSYKWSYFRFVKNNRYMFRLRMLTETQIRFTVVKSGGFEIILVTFGGEFFGNELRFYTPDGKLVKSIPTSEIKAMHVNEKDEVLYIWTSEGFSVASLVGFAIHIFQHHLLVDVTSVTSNSDDGEIYVCDRVNGIVVFSTKDYRFLRVLEKGPLILPYSVAYSHKERKLLVVDSGQPKVFVMC